MTRRSDAPAAPRLVGVAGAGLENASWAANADVARVGQAGERRTAAVLAALTSGRYAETGPSVLHDLRIPIALRDGGAPNIDHVVVSGRDVWLLDSKVWKPGRYWTLRGHTRRGFERIAWADKQTMVMARQAIAGRLYASGVLARVHRPILVVWSSSSAGAPRLAWYRPKGARAVSGEGGLERMMRSWRKPAHPGIVSVLSALVVSTETPRRPGLVEPPPDWR